MASSVGQRPIKREEEDSNDECTLPFSSKTGAMKGNLKQAICIDDEDEDGNEASQRPIKKEEEDSDDECTFLSSSKNTAMNDDPKQAICIDDDDDDDDDESTSGLLPGPRKRQGCR
ncbi:hypothetical protein H9Q74_003989 [Fusarium xylarioides]|nr:hypothetical protein H9Q71_000857 [Fusarium xylarioides]KAG5825940.1 hypothetical protein H9Q74_003989 [Fusarium xylarioides]